MTNQKEQLEDRSTCALPNDHQKYGIVWWAVLKTIQTALLTIGMALGAIYIAARVESYYASRSAIERFESAEPVMSAQPPAEDDGMQAVTPDFSGWGEGRIRAYVDAAKRAGGAPLALLEIPKIHLQAPVLDRTDSLTLNHAVGRIAGTAMPGEARNIAIAGHRDGFFRGLKDIQPGDEIDLRSHGGIDIYTVDRIQIVGPRDVSVLHEQRKPALTLVTCYPFYFVGNAPKRYVVTAFLTQHSNAGSTTTETRLNLQSLNQTQEEQ